MSISKSWMAVPENRARVVSLYTDMERLLTVEEIARRLKTTHATVSRILREDLEEPVRKALAALRYSKSKTGSKNPMKGKTQSRHHNWKGLCENSDGYLTVLHNGTRQMVHRVAMAQALGLRRLPEKWAVHHIDGDKQNNTLDNLALVTAAGHKAIHSREMPLSALQSRRATIAGTLASLTSRSKETTPS